MRTFKERPHRMLLAVFALAGVTAAVPAFPELLLQQERTNARQSVWPNTVKADAPALETKVDTSQELFWAVRHGMWTRACGLASNILAEYKEDLDALGVFAICQALLAREEETAIALTRLRDVESSPGYYTNLVQGVAHLRHRSLNEADADLRQALANRQNDPLAMYFRGELLHAQRKDAEAVTAFSSVLNIWPDFAPALSATARLMVEKDAPKQALDTAISMSERAALIEPMNKSYWSQTADLYEQAGQHDRAQAIRLQWLNRPSFPSGRE